MCHDCRQIKVQHCGLTFSETASISLLDVLHQVPTLPRILNPDSQKALSATCKSCCLQFIGQVQVVTIVCEEDYAQVFERRWPRLCMVILLGDAYVPPPPTMKIFNIYVAAEGNIQALISLLKPLQDLAIDLPWTPLAAQQLAHQMRIRWPMMRYFRMSLVHDVDGLGLEVVSQLVKGKWRHLVSLRLCDCELKAEALLILSQGHWPCLIFLDISGNYLDAEGMALLATGNWPRLWCIKLDFNSRLGAVAVAQLCAANWPIEISSIKDTPFSVDMVAALADLQLPELRQVRLMGSGLTAAAVFELARADWPSLSCLDLDMGHDDLDAVAAVLGVSPEKVQELKSNTRVSAVFEQRMLSSLDTGLWPNLRRISISKDNIHLSS